MSDGKIYVVITDNPGKLGGNLKPKEDEEAQKKIDSPKKFIEHEFFNFIEAQAKKFVTTAVSTIGARTGNYQAQGMVQDGIKSLGFVSSVAVAAIYGAKWGIPGIAASVGVTVVSQGINIGYSEYVNNLEIGKQNREISVMRQKSGLDMYTNGSR